MAGNGTAIMIRQAQLHGGDAQAIQPAADVLLLFPAAIPFREHYHGRAAAARLENLRVHPIIFWPGGSDGAGEGEDVVRERIVVSWVGGEPFVAVRYGF